MIQAARNGRVTNLWSAITQWLTLTFEGKKQKSTIASLDGVRAIACLIVVAYHLTLITTNDIPLWYPKRVSGFLDALAFAGDTGVTLFFVLSGFLLFLPYAKALLFNAPWPSFRQFYLRRALRILPAYYVTLFLLIFIRDREYLRPDHLKDLLLFLTLFMDSSGNTFKMINGPFWTLAVEWQFYLWLPIMAYGMLLAVRPILLAVRSKTRLGEREVRAIALAICLLVVIGWGLLTRYIGLYLTDHPHAATHFPQPVLNVFLFLFYGIPTSGLHGKFLEDFAIGMIVSSAYLLIRSYPANGRVDTLVRKLSPWLFVVGLLWLYGLYLWKYDQRAPHTWPLLDHVLRFYTLFSELNYSIGFGLCVFAILLGPELLKKFFEWRPLRWIGLLSFGLYMWHLILLEDLSKILVGQLYDAGWPHKLLYSFYWVWLFAIIIPAMFLLFISIEKPFMQFADRFRGKTSTRGVAEADNVTHNNDQSSPNTSSTALASQRSEEPVR